MDPNPHYLVQVEGWRGAVRQSEAPPNPVPAVPAVQMVMRVLARVGAQPAPPLRTAA